MKQVLPKLMMPNSWVLEVYFFFIVTVIKTFGSMKSLNSSVGILQQKVNPLPSSSNE